MSTTNNLFMDSMFESFNAYSASDQVPLILGESVFGSFQKSKVKSEYSQPVSMPISNITISPSLTVSPFDIHSSVLDSVFSTPALDDCSPMFEEVENFDESNNWVSLFDDEKIEELVGNEKSETVDLQEELINDEINKEMIKIEQSPLLNELLLNQTKKRSYDESNSSSPNEFESSKLSNTKKDHLGCIQYNRKQRSIPLMEIDPSDDDPIAVKRARNTEAARRSRARKMERMNQLEDKVEELMTKNQNLENEIERLRALLK